jgi:hypothetical protein
VAARSNVWVCGSSLASIVGSKPFGGGGGGGGCFLGGGGVGGRGCLFLVRVLCFQIEVSSTN